VPLDHEPTGNARTQPRLTRSGRTLFVLDEPTVGLHPSDVRRLIECLGFLLQTGHSVIVIDHDPLLIANSDWEIRLGPAAGKYGGRVIHAGPVHESLTEN
jgi:excinuclease ABC subunit A